LVPVDDLAFPISDVESFQKAFENVFEERGRFI
jgi:hypothetical protein